MPINCHLFSHQLSFDDPKLDCQLRRRILKLSINKLFLGFDKFRNKSCYPNKVYN